MRCMVCKIKINWRVYVAYTCDCPDKDAEDHACEKMREVLCRQGQCKRCYRLWGHFIETGMIAFPPLTCRMELSFDVSWM